MKTLTWPKRAMIWTSGCLTSERHLLRSTRSWRNRVRFEASFYSRGAIMRKKSGRNGRRKKRRISSTSRTSCLVIRSLRANPMPSPRKDKAARLVQVQRASVVKDDPLKARTNYKQTRSLRSVMEWQSGKLLNKFSGMMAFLLGIRVHSPTLANSATTRRCRRTYGRNLCCYLTATQ